MSYLLVQCIFDSHVLLCFSFFLRFFFLLYSSHSLLCSKITSVYYLFQWCPIIKFYIGFGLFILWCRECWQHNTEDKVSDVIRTESDSGF